MVSVYGASEGMRRGNDKSTKRGIMMNGVVLDGEHGVVGWGNYWVNSSKTSEITGKKIDAK